VRVEGVCPRCGERSLKLEVEFARHSLPWFDGMKLSYIEGTATLKCESCGLELKSNVKFHGGIEVEEK